MKFGQFYQTQSIIHKIDARLKFFILMLASTQIFFIDKSSSYIPIIIALFFCIYLSNVPLKLFFSSIKNITMIIVFTSLLNIFFITNGNTLFKFFFIRITDYALIFTTQMILRLIILVLLSSLLTFTTSAIQLTDALVNMMMPFKKILPTNEIAMIITISLRFISVLSDEFNLIMKAQSSRGINFKEGNFIQRIKKYLALLIPIFISSFRHADDLALAMEARCYNPNAKRNSLKKLKLQAVDFYAIIFLCLFHFIVYAFYFN